MGKRKWKNKTDTLTYNSWRSMRSRCLFNSNNTKNHKDKGITICKEWNDYDTFIKDMGERPEGTTLDRRNNRGNYEPSNCRWSDWREQQNNKESLTKITKDGVTHTIGEWAYILDYNTNQLSRTYKRYNTYKCTSYDELFYEGSLLEKRTKERRNECQECGLTTSCKWRKNGTQCNNCYAKEYRRKLKK